MGFNFNIFSSGGGSLSVNGFAKYPNAAALPALASDGDVAITLDTDDLYAFNSGLNSWVIIGGPGVAFSVTDTSSIDMSLVGNILQADLRISGITGLPANTLGTSLSVYAGASPGLIGYIPTGAFSEVTSSVLQFSGPGVAAGGTFGIRVNQATGSTPGFLSAADFSRFATGVSALLNTAFPILGGGLLSSGLTLSVPVANGTTGGYLSATDWTTFNNKVPTARSIGTTFPILGGGDLSADRVLSMPVANGSTGGYLSATDWTTFNNKIGSLSIGSFSYAAFAQGFTIVSSTITLGVGDATNPGAIGTTAQTIAGVKTFNQDAQFQSFVRFGGASLVSIGSTTTAGQTLMWSGGVGATYSNLINDGRGFMSWSYAVPGFYRTVTNLGATLALQDRFIEVTTGATNQTLNIGWAAAGNTSIIFSVQKIDSGLGTVTIQSPDLINGVTNFTFSNQWETHQLVCNGLGFRVVT